MNSLKKCYNRKRLLKVIKGSTFFCSNDKKFESLPLKRFRINSTSVKDHPYLRLQNQGKIYYSSDEKITWSDLFRDKQKNLSLVVSAGRYVNPQEFAQEQNLQKSFYSLQSQLYSLARCLDYHDKSLNKSTSAR